MKKEFVVFKNRKTILRMFFNFSGHETCCGSRQNQSQEFIYNYINMIWNLDLY